MLSLLKRQYKRIKPPHSYAIEVQIMGSNSPDVLKASDISVSGVGVRMPHRFEGCNINTEVELVITLPSCGPFPARGIIRHITSIYSSNDLFGIEFTHISDTNRNHLRTYIDEHNESH